MDNFSKQCNLAQSKTSRNKMYKAIPLKWLLSLHLKMASLMPFFMVIILLFDSSNPSGCVMVSGWSFEFHFPDY